MKNPRWSRLRRSYRGWTPFVVFAVGIALFFTFSITAMNTAWSHDVCTVTGKYTNPLKASRGQTFDFIRTTCGDLGFNRWLKGSDGFEVLEVGKTYELGLNGFSYLWAKPSVVSWDEVN